jgi:iron(III) transport system substrate-binding protein
LKGNSKGSLTRRAFIAGTGLVAMSLVLTACGGDAEGSKAATKAEDKVIVYYSTRPEEGLPPLKKAFETANPGYELRIIRASSSDTVARLITEAQAGRQQADVTELNALPMSQLAKARLLAKLPDSVLSALPDTAKAKDGTYAGTRYFGHLTPYNTKLVPAAEQPKSYEDFLKPYWKGKFVVGANDVEWAYQVFAAKGEDEGRKFLEQIAAQKPQVRDEGRGALAELVAIGQSRAAIMTLSYHVERRAKKGLPIAGAEWAPPLLNIDWMATFKGAPHPNSTKVFLDWLYSKEGIATDAELGFARIGDEGTAAALDQPNLLILEPSTADAQDRAAKAFKEIFSIG